MNNELIIIAGPTAAGKSAYAVDLAERIGGEVISGDSMQVYRGMDIGTAKITREEMRGIPHHLIDIVDPQDPWNVALFVEKATQAISEIRARGHVPIVAGGTGFYLHALAYGADFSAEETDGPVRRELEAMAQTEDGRAQLWKMLNEKDPESTAVIHPNNVKRLIRALEYYENTGEKISMLNQRQHAQKSPYDLQFYVLTMDRDKLYERIDRRVEQMIRDGLVDEVRTLLKNGARRDMVSMQGLGYKEIIAYLEGEMPLDEAVRVIQRDTRHFAKRQLTWFRREEAIWLKRDGNVWLPCEKE